ncbi:hypothetical protein [Microbacterium sp.]|uniref:hypothetical protein n=1 Tax=Microbacterium sp. TaxID=51671 RepID=UPI0028123468|nr:hypothetical protein [Microbacterium sp.]
MKENFLRPPASVGEFAADALRLLGALGVMAAAIWTTLTDAGILALALPALMLPRVLGLRAWFDIAVSATVLVAAWSNVLDLYRTVTGWDLVVHFVCTGVIAATAYIVLARLGIVPTQDSDAFTGRGAIVITSVLGLAVSALWEMVEWAGHAFITDEIFVTYADTIGDMAVGGIGAIVAGVVVARVRLERPAAVRATTP